jgi:hypothetical protein
MAASGDDVHASTDGCNRPLGSPRLVRRSMQIVLLSAGSNAVTDPEQGVPDPLSLRRGKH